MYSITTAIRKLHKLSSRIRIIQGGTAAGKTIGVLAYLIHKAQTDKTPTLTSVVSESFPHLKRGSIRDFLNIMESQKYYKDKNWNRSDYVYTFETGSKIEFFSADQPSKVRGPRRDRLFINEANNVPFETYEQLEVRTREIIIIDYNPTNEFWAHEHLLQGNHGYDFLVLTYKDNEALDTEIVKSIESRKHRRNWWKVYGLGELGELEGRIYTNWQIVDDVPHEARLERYGLDFGYTNDPTALVAVYYYNGGYIVDQHLYRIEMSNREIGNYLKNIDQAIVVADSAEPKSIDEIRKYGVNIIPCAKGPDSVRHGIKAVADQRISVTKRSLDIIKEHRNYLWDTDKEGNLLPGIPEKGNDHCMDAVRYAINSMVPVQRKKELYYRPPRRTQKKTNIGL